MMMILSYRIRIKQISTLILISYYLWVLGVSCLVDADRSPEVGRGNVKIGHSGDG